MIFGLGCWVCPVLIFERSNLISGFCELPSDDAFISSGLTSPLFGLSGGCGSAGGTFFSVSFDNGIAGIVEFPFLDRDVRETGLETPIRLGTLFCVFEDGCESLRLARDGGGLEDALLPPMLSGLFNPS